MKNTIFKALATLTILSLTTALRAESEKAAPPPADPVAVMRNHDGAFAFLIETFRQMQTALIENDYTARQQAADKLTDTTKREDVRNLIEQERTLRLAKLDHQLTNLRTTYDYARKTDERELGVSVAPVVDTAAAAEKLKDFVAIIPAFDPKDEIVITRIVPADLVLAGKHYQKTPSQVASR